MTEPSVEQGQWHVEWEEHGGYDAMSPAWVIYAKLADGRETALTIDRADFDSDEDCAAFKDALVADHTTAALVPGLLAALRKLAEGDAHSEGLAEDRHCPACRASLDFEKHEGDCYLAAIIDQAEAAQQGTPASE